MLLFKSQIDEWVSEKLVKIRRVLDRCYKKGEEEVKRNSDSDSDEEYHQTSAVDMFRILFETVDKLYMVIGEAIFDKWSRSI